MPPGPALPPVLYLNFKLQIIYHISVDPFIVFTPVQSLKLAALELDALELHPELPQPVHDWGGEVGKELERSAKYSI